MICTYKKCNNNWKPKSRMNQFKRMLKNAMFGYTNTRFKYPKTRFLKRNRDYPFKNNSYYNL